MLNLPHITTLFARPSLPAHCTVFLADISQNIISDSDARLLLSQTQLRRVEKFLSSARRQQHVQCHALLRLLLAERIGLDAAQITFDTGTFNKPALSGKAAESGIEFNIAHSGSFAVFAISNKEAVGVDIEQVKAGRNVLGITDHYFAKAERHAIRALPPSSQQDAFYSCWSRKESVIKAAGLGMHIPFDQFVVNVDPVAEARLLSMDYPGLRANDWQMYTLLTPEGYFGALTTGNCVD